MTATDLSSSAPSAASRQPNGYDVLQQQLLAVRAQLVATQEQVDSLLALTMLLAQQAGTAQLGPAEASHLAQALRKINDAHGRNGDPAVTFGGAAHGASSSPSMATTE